MNRPPRADLSTIRVIVALAPGASEPRTHSSFQIGGGLGEPIRESTSGAEHVPCDGIALTKRTRSMKSYTPSSPSMVLETLAALTVSGPLFHTSIVIGIC